MPKFSRRSFLVFFSESRTISRYALSLLLQTWVVSQLNAQLPAFPGAEGFGSTTPGGRGGRVYFVTTLDPTGPGSLSEAVEANDPRIIVFKVGGTIDFAHQGGSLTIENPYLTIAGQTAPGGGITLKNCRLLIQTHDVIVRCIRSRMGDLPGGLRGQARDAITIGSKSAYNVIIDHCSFSWAVDENAEIIGGAHDVTVQYCYVGEALRSSIHQKGQHSKSLSCHHTSGGNVSFHHNIIAHGVDRNPQMLAPFNIECVNNIVYNFQFGGRFGNGASIHFIGNRYIAGPNTKLGRKALIAARRGLGGSKAFVKGNIGPGRTENQGEEWLIADAPMSDQSTALLFEPKVTPEDVDSLWPDLLDIAGALPHDAVDQRTQSDILDRSGHWIDSQDEVGGWPLLERGTPPPDADNDGMPDEWEVVNGLNPQDINDGNFDQDQDGYLNIEEYINQLIPSTK